MSFRKLLRRSKWLLLIECVFILSGVLIACAPGVTGTLQGVSPGMYRAEFTNTTGVDSQFRMVILGNVEVINDERCKPGENSSPSLQVYNCDFGTKEKPLLIGNSIIPIEVIGTKLSCEIYRLTDFIYIPCDVKEIGG